MMALIKNSFIHILAIVLALVLIFIFKFENKSMAQNNVNLPPPPQVVNANQNMNQPAAQPLPPVSNNLNKPDAKGYSSDNPFTNKQGSGAPPVNSPAPAVTNINKPQVNVDDLSDPMYGNYETIKNARVYVGDPQSSERDPFRKPFYLMKIEDDSKIPEIGSGNGMVPSDVERLEAIRRWPLQSYRLTGVIWNVNQPKAIIVDPTGVLHIVKKNYRIGDRNGVISSIEEGSIVVKQEGVPIVINISKGGATRN